MTKDPWTDRDPQPGDLDAELALLEASAFDYHEGDPSATLRIVVSVEGEDASEAGARRWRGPAEAAWMACLSHPLTLDRRPAGT